MKIVDNFLLLLMSCFFLSPLSLNAEEDDSLNQPFDALKHLEIYNSALRELDINYVDTIKHLDLLELSLGRMLYELDPYTTYIPKQDSEMLQRMNKGQYGGVGSVITQVDGQPFFSDPYVGMPAYENGLRAGDRIISIDGEKCSGLQLSEVSDMLRGKPGSEIKIEVVREGETKPIRAKFQRAIIKTETVPYYSVLKNGVGYVVINDFIDRTASDFSKAVAEMVKTDNINKLVIDLRGNGGGLVSQAVEIAGLFVPQGTMIVEMKSKHKSNDHKYITKNQPLYPDMKVAFLIDNATASSSELLTGAMQDIDRAVVVGTRSFGKGLVQSVRQLPYESYLKLTVAKYYLPSGRCIQAIDYSNENEDNREIPDSLTVEYKTSLGRTVRDGSGITPDSTIVEDEKYNIASYLYVKQVYFKYANKFVAQNPIIADPSDFELTDHQYEDFVKFVESIGFKYQLVSNKYLISMQKMIKMEGYDEVTAEYISKLSELLQPNIQRDLTLFKEDVKMMLETEIIKRYYFHHGMYEYLTKKDKTISTAAEMVNGEVYNKILLQ